MMQELQQIINACGLTSMQIKKVAGGDINEACKLYNDRQCFFLKLNDAELYQGMFVA